MNRAKWAIAGQVISHAIYKQEKVWVFGVC